MNRTIVIYTIGHSNRQMQGFTGLLQKNTIEILIDIRKLPGSAKYPHFNQDVLSRSLGEAGISYLHIKELGGRRKPNKDSINTAWKSKSFQAFADYINTEDFRKGIDTLLKYASEKRAALMCSEAVWWRCHRALIADDLKSRDIEVYHILGPAAPQLHPYTSAARIREGRLTYYD